MATKFVMNFSDEDYVPDPNGIFIKRFSKFRDDSFIYAVEQYLNELDFDGVCYLGEKRGDVLFEHVSQDVWEKSVLYHTKYIVFFVSGKDSLDKNQEYLEYRSYINSFGHKKPKIFTVNENVSDPGTDEDYENLKDILSYMVGVVKNYSKYIR